MTAAPPSALVPENRPFQPYGKAEEFLYCRAPEVLLSGPAGTGKSRACLEKLHICAQKYDGMRGLIVRKTRESLTESALVTFEEKVVPQNHYILRTGGQRKMRQSYLYSNGSSIVVGGMDKPSKTLSTEFDLIYVQEAIELTEHDWEMLTRPLRNGKMPYQQIIADTNPDAPTHWLKRRCDAGRTLMLESTHEDNPVLFDRNGNGGLGDWTESGKLYIGRLDNLTGPRKPRLRYGKWVQAEGVVYEGWDRHVHLVDRFNPPAAWPRYWSIDFGFTNPFTWQLWALDPDGRLFLVKQIYKTQGLVEDHAKRILQLARMEIPYAMRRDANDLLGDLRPQAIICDHDAEGRATLEKYLGMPTLPANKEIMPGIQAVQTRLKKAGDNKPRLYVMRDSLDERDALLMEAKRPCCLEEEMDSYIWKPQTAVMAESRNRPDEPIDRDNHGCDAMRYMVAHLEAGVWSLPDPDKLKVDKAKRDHRQGMGASHAASRGMYGMGRDRNDD